MTFRYNIHERYVGTTRSWPRVGVSDKKLAKEILALLVARKPKNHKEEQMEYCIVLVHKPKCIER